MSIWNDLGFGIMGLSQGLDKGWDRQLQGQKLQLMQQGQERSDALAQEQIGIEKLKAEMMRQKMQREASFMDMLGIGNGGGGGGQTPAQTAPMAPSAPTPSLGGVPGGPDPATVRANNPGAIMPNGQMATYDSPLAGAQALNALIQRRYTPQNGVNNLNQFFATYAPAGHGNNNPQAYAAYVGKQMGIDPSAPIDVTNPVMRSQLMQHIAAFEGGPAAKGAFNADMFEQAAGLPNSAPPQGTQPYNGKMYAQNGPPTATDAGGRSPSSTNAPQFPDWYNDPKRRQAVFNLASMGYEQAVAAVNTIKTIQGMQEHETPEQKSDRSLRDEGKKKRQDQEIAKVNPTLSPDLEIVNSLAPGYANGTVSDEERRRYDIAFYNHYGKTETRPDGSQVRPDIPVSLPVPSGWSAQVAGPKPMNQTDAAKFSAVQQGLKLVNEFEAAVLPNGEYNRSMVANMQLNPFSDDKQWKDKIMNAVDAVVKARTGAAASNEEMARYNSMFVPSTTDSHAVAKNKLQMLRDFFQGTIDLSGGPKQPSATPSAPSPQWQDGTVLQKEGKLYVVKNGQPVPQE